mmetsp:Transcript_28319/g.27253  ORF Transcript_28319/g.27253 Transcript_28319/m.27253 type:complete len:142 (+) Transcript_28319:442-867(+)
MSPIRTREDFPRTRGFRLGLAKDQVESSDCFESLHELCNIQIEELKKTVRVMTDEREDLIGQMDDTKDKYQDLLNERMEQEMLYNAKCNEVSYLHKYLDDYEKEIDSLKTALETQHKKMSEEKQELREKLGKVKEKKSILV